MASANAAPHDACHAAVGQTFPGDDLALVDPTEYGLAGRERRDTRPDFESLACCRHIGAR